MRNIACCLLCLCLICAAGTPQVKISGNYLQKSRELCTREEFQRLTAGRVRFFRQPLLKASDGSTLLGSRNGIVLRHGDGTVEPFPPDRILPCSEITVLAEERPGILWIGTTHGAIRYERDRGTSTIQLFAGKRWLPDDHVAGVGFDPRTGDVWVETAQGFCSIHFKPMTLAEKARAFEERVRARHLRHGLTASSHLSDPGNLASSHAVSSDNDGLWTAMYVAAQCFRYKVTGEASAHASAKTGIEALMKLEAITGIPGFPARSIIKVGSEDQPSDGEWHLSPDGAWKWKGDTSSDEIVGHYFAYGLYYELVADAGEKRQIRAVVERITSHILDHGYRLIDLDGKPTTWGWWGPDDIWKDPDETGLRALHMLSHLRVACQITGNARYEAAFEDLVKNHKYALLTRNQKINIPGRINHSDDELAFLSFYPLLRYEQHPELKKIFQESLERSWQCERPERNPLWNFIYAAGTGSRNFDFEESIRTLQLIPMDLISWSVANSHRLDVPIDPLADRFRSKQALVVLPPDERPLMKWNGNPYSLDGGDGGRSEDDGAFFLLPYWMARYHRLIE